MASVKVDKAAFGFFIKKLQNQILILFLMLVRFLTTSFANFIPASGELLPKNKKNLPTSSAAIVLTLTVFFFYYIEHIYQIFFSPLLVKSLSRDIVAD